MKIVVLDAATLGADLDLSPLQEFGEVIIRQNTAPEEVADALADADAADLLARVPDRDRRAVASNGVREAAAAYLAGSGDD